MVPHALPTVCFMKKSAGGGEELAQASSSWEEWGWGWGAGKRGLIRGRGNGLNGGEGGSTRRFSGCSVPQPQHFLTQLLWPVHPLLLLRGSHHFSRRD